MVFWKARNCGLLAWAPRAAVDVYLDGVGYGVGFAGEDRGGWNEEVKPQMKWGMVRRETVMLQDRKGEEGGN
jgi:hypothetical protein